MRLFIAIDLNDEEYFQNIQDKIDSKDSKISFTKTFHLTLKFLGEVNESHLPKIKQALNNTTFNPFKIKTTKIGVFPNQDFIKVIWIGLEPEETIKKLQNQIDENLKSMFKPEKNFKSHITLARVKFTKNKIQFTDNLKQINIPEKEFEIKKIHLIRSTLTPSGPVYEELF